MGCFLVSKYRPSTFRLALGIFVSIFLLALTNYLYHKNVAIYWSPIGILLIDALILSLIIAHGSIDKAASNNKIYLVFGFLGSISYGIYAWHPLWMRFIDDIQIQPFYVSVFILFITIVIATISYKLMELPSLKLRRY